MHPKKETGTNPEEPDSESYRGCDFSTRVFQESSFSRTVMIQKIFAQNTPCGGRPVKTVIPKGGFLKPVYLYVGKTRPARLIM
jgi:hypothetical protein